jgi:hypothetical protein
MSKKYLSNVGKATWVFLLSADCLLNAIVGGDPQEYASSRMGKMVRTWKQNPQNKARFLLACGLCKILSIFEKNHCEKSIQEGEGSDDLWAARKIELERKKKK